MFDRATGIILALAVAAALLGGLAQTRRAPPPDRPPAVSPMAGQPLPPLTLTDLEGRRHSLASYRGHRLLINFWASWCTPCLREMPTLDAAQRKFADQGAIVLGIAMDQPSRIRAYLARQPVSYPILLGSMETPSTSRQLGDEAEILPFSVLVGADGRIIDTHAGELSDETLGRWLAPAADGP